MPADKTIQTVEGALVVPKGARFALVASRFNAFIVERLLEGAVDALLRHGAEASSLSIVRVPGAWEIPLVCARIAKSKKVDAIVALGAVIRGAPERAIADLWNELPGDAEGREYADSLVRGVRSALDKVDERIRAASQNWRLERMSRIDRNALRLGAYELMTRAEVPRAVILDEAVELAKRFGSDESGGFVNGVLDRIADDLGRVDQDRGEP